MMTRTVSVLKPIAIDAVNKYDFTLFSTVTQRFLQFCRLMSRSDFSLIMSRKIVNFQ